MKFIGMKLYSKFICNTYCKLSLNWFETLDIGANLTDGMFQGIYNGSQKHPDDLDIVLERSWNSGVEKIIVTVGCINDHADAVKLVQKDGMNAHFLYAFFRAKFSLSSKFIRNNFLPNLIS